MPRFAVGARVWRNEGKAETAATVAQIDVTNEQPFYLLAYPEGGEGWWPESALTESV